MQIGRNHFLWEKTFSWTVTFSRTFLTISRNSSQNFSKNSDRLRRRCPDTSLPTSRVSQLQRPLRPFFQAVKKILNFQAIGEVKDTSSLGYYNRLFLVKIYLIDVYHHFLVHVNFRKYFRFVIAEKSYQFCVLLFGLSTAIREFTKTLHQWFSCSVLREYESMPTSTTEFSGKNSPEQILQLTRQTIHLFQSFSPTHLRGARNVTADALSRLNSVSPTEWRLPQ